MYKKPTILLADDDVKLLRSAELLLQDTFKVLAATDVAQAKAMLTHNSSIEIAVFDLSFEGQDEDGLSLIDWTLKNKPRTPIAVLSGDTNTKRVVEAMHRQLIDFIPKTSEYESDLRSAIARGLELRKTSERNTAGACFETRSPAVRKLLEQVDLIASKGSRCSILVSGETGSGKEVLAKYIANASKRALVSANMANIGRERAESELFGHKRGAFTDAKVDKPGLILQANNGIFFLDELGECSLDVQAKLLRAIQEQEIQPLGALKPVKVSVQFVAATNCDLQRMVSQGDFRLDLLQRLSTFTLHLPPLRERPEDIEYYTTLFLEELSGDEPFSIRASGIGALANYSWPGNVRELRNFVERITVLAKKRVLDEELVQQFLNVPLAKSETGDRSANLRTQIMDALEKAYGNRTHAAALMNMPLSTFYRWINRVGVSSHRSGRSGRPLLPLETHLSNRKELA